MRFLGPAPRPDACRPQAADARALGDRREVRLEVDLPTARAVLVASPDEAEALALELLTAAARARGEVDGAGFLASRGRPVCAGSGARLVDGACAACGGRFLRPPGAVGPRTHAPAHEPDPPALDAGRARR